MDVLREKGGRGSLGCLVGCLVRVDLGLEELGARGLLAGKGRIGDRGFVRWARPYVPALVKSVRRS